MDKVRKQLAGVSALVDFWWQGVWHDLQQVAMTPRWTRWVEDLLLPLMYWQEQMSRTRCPRRKAKLFQALEAVQAAFNTPPCTEQRAPDVLEAGQGWAAEQAKACQRASSAVEGRNGDLSQCLTSSGACPSAATGCGRCYITSIVVPQMGRRRHRGFSDGDFLTSLKRCCHKSMTCRGLENETKPWR